MEKINFAFQVLVLGFLVVLVTLFALYGILLLFNRIFKKNGKPAAAPGVSPPATPAKTPGSEPALTIKPAEGQAEPEGPLVAAITAAVSAYLQAEQRGDPPAQGVDLRPEGGCSVDSWKISGRKILLEGSLELEKMRRIKQRENI